MVYKSIVLFVLLLIGTTEAFAVTDDELINKYGSRLYSATIEARYAFQRQTGVRWDSSTKSQRKKFLEQWETQQIAKAQQAAEEKKYKDEVATAKRNALRDKEIYEQRKKADEASQQAAEAYDAAQAKKDRIRKNEMFKQRISDLKDGDRK